MSAAANNRSKSINRFLLDNRIRIQSNPAISPDLTLDFPELLRELQAQKSALLGLAQGEAAEKVARALTGLLLYPKSRFDAGSETFFLIESATSGDGALMNLGHRELPLSEIETLGEASLKLRVIPLTWENLIALKNLVLETDPGSTLFPKAASILEHSSLGIGARFTTLHWPAVAWAMKTLRLPLTANQNSIPRELVYDIDAMLEGRLAEVPFPFIGGSVPEGHQGQSVQGMTHAAIITYLKFGFHRHRIPWGFNADHQPIGGRFDAIEKELVAGSLFASYITYDLSPELSLHQPIADAARLEAEFPHLIDAQIHNSTLARLAEVGLSMDALELKRLMAYIAPAMEKMRRRDALYTAIRREHFTTEEGRRFFKELSIDELPGQTTPETLAVCLAMGEAMGVRFNFVAPNIGFQKNMPYPDNKELREKVERLFAVARKFGVSFGFHSGSGKSAENYRVLGEVTSQRLEIKTSGRYTYEMGAALYRSSDPSDQALWRDWYAFTRRLALEGAFAENDTRRKFAREFIEHAFSYENKPAAGIFDSPAALEKALASLAPSPEHMFWFEYNFLYVLAAGGDSARLGDHTPAGYAQRARFYGIADAGRLEYAKGVAEYILFLAESTALASLERVAEARARLKAFPTYAALLEDIG